MHNNNLNTLLPDNLIDKNTNYEELIEKLFKLNIEEILNKHKLLSDSYDDENLHQMRISLRKFKSYLSLIKNDMTKNEWKYANNLYKKLIKPTSRTRDYDIFRSDYLYPAYINFKDKAEFQKLYEKFETKQNILHESTETHITSQEYMNYLHELRTWIAMLKIKNMFSKHANCKGDELIIFINKRMQNRYKNIIKTKEHILSFNQKELHRYRVDIKELRYILEVLGSYIKHGKKEAKFLKRMQEILGKINDTFIAENVVQSLNVSNNRVRSQSYLEQRAFDQRHRYLLQLENIK